jgi:predicted DNA-binding transcriptional regulator AlpA
MPEILRFGQLRAAGVPYSRPTINQMVDAGTFPPPIRYGKSQRAWLASDVTAWATAFRASRGV